MNLFANTLKTTGALSFAALLAFGVQTQAHAATAGSLPPAPSVSAPAPAPTLAPGAVGKMLTANDDIATVEKNGGTTRIPLTLNDVAVDGLDLDSVNLVEPAYGPNGKEMTTPGGTHKLGVATTADGDDYVYDDFTPATDAVVNPTVLYSVVDANGSFGMAEIQINIADTAVPAPELNEPPVDPNAPITTPETPVDVPVTVPEVPAETPVDVPTEETPSDTPADVPAEVVPNGSDTPVTSTTPEAVTPVLPANNVAESGLDDLGESAATAAPVASVSEGNVTALDFMLYAGLLAGALAYSVRYFWMKAPKVAKN